MFFIQKIFKSQQGGSPIWLSSFPGLNPSGSLKRKPPNSVFLTEWWFRLCRFSPYFFILLCFLFSCNNQEKTASGYIKDGINYTREQQYDLAISAYKKAIKSEPKNAFAYYALGGIYTLKNMHEKAIEVHKKAIELDPDFPDPHYSLGFVYEKLGRKKEADEEYLLFEKLKNSSKIRQSPGSYIM